jgi:predicted nucleotidyltransferase
LAENPWDKSAQEAVEFDKQIEPGKSYTRLLAHKVTIYKVEDPRWNSKGNFSVPHGKLEMMLEVDLGEEFMVAMNGAREVVIEEKAEHYFSDGSVVRGARTKLVPGESRLEELKDFLEIEHNLKERRRREGEFNYDFEINVEKVTDPNNPLEIHVETYHKIGDKILKPVNKEIALVARYEPREITHGFRLLYRKTSPNLIIK